MGFSISVMACLLVNFMFNLFVIISDRNGVSPSIDQQCVHDDYADLVFQELKYRDSILNILICISILYFKSDTDCFRETSYLDNLYKVSIL